MSLELVRYPNPKLLRPCGAWRFGTEREPVTGLTLPELAEAMFEVMYANRGVGLAANQVGVLWRIFVADKYAHTERQGEERIVAINPELSELDGQQIGREGCLSIDPRISFPVRRAMTCHFKAYDLDGNLFEGDAEGFEARLLQHECDHLEGRCCIDLTDKFSREIAMKKWRKLMKRAA